MRFSKLVNKKYLELLGEKTEKRLAAHVGYKKIQDNVPLKGKLSPKSARVGVNTDSMGNSEPFTSLGKKGGVHDVRETGRKTIV